MAKLTTGQISQETALVTNEIVLAASSGKIKSERIFSPRHIGRKIVALWDDWIGGTVTSNYGWTISTSGSGATVTPVTGLPNRPGILEFRTGTLATGRAALVLGLDSILLGAGVTELGYSILIPTLSTISERYIFRIGFGDVNTGADNADGVYFEYNEASSPNWFCKTANNSIRTSVNSGVAVNTIWTNLYILINSSATLAQFYINDVLVASINTNIPTATGRETGLIGALIKSVGTTSRTARLDYMFLRIELNSER